MPALIIFEIEQCRLTWLGWLSRGICGIGACELSSCFGVVSPSRLSYAIVKTPRAWVLRKTASIEDSCELNSFDYCGSRSPGPMEKL